MSKDLIRLGWCIVIGLLHRQKIKIYIRDYKYILGVFIILLVRSFFWSRYQNVSLWLLIIWFKYVLYPVMIMITAIWLWYCISSEDLHIYLKRFGHISILILASWILRFVIKLSFPDFMIQIWYGSVGDFVVWHNPPLYYRTGAGGRPRYSWLMAWPNNLAYLLVWLWPLWWLLWQFTQFRIVYIIGWAISIISTISRSARIATVVQYLIIRHHLLVSLSRRLIYLLLCVAGAGMVMLMSLKYQSTLWHVNRTIEAISTRYQQPLWYGLWYSGPSALHHGSIIPENIYLQWLIDIGVLGFVCIWSIITLLIIKIRSLSNHFFVPYLRARCVGMIGLAIQWMFLHVLEDSTVNYLVLVIGWLLLWYLSNQHDHSKHDIIY